MHVTMQLLNSDLCAHLGHLVSDLLGLFLRDCFFNGLGSLINHSLCLFQTQAGDFAHNFDDVDLVGANLTEDGVELGLLFNRSCSRGSLLSSDRGTSSGYRSRAHAPLLL